MSSPEGTTWSWLRSGNEAFPAMLAAIGAARKSIRLEVYIFTADALGQSFLRALIEARQRGVSVRVLVDAIGSLTLPDAFWTPLREAGGEARFFNPIDLRRFEIRNHRKLLVCDDRVAFVGGFNIAPEYEGDGVTRGWRDIGVRIEGRLAAEMGFTFDEMYVLADFRHKRLVRFRKSKLKRAVEESGTETLLLGGPGRGRNPIKRRLLLDISGAADIRIMVAYFLPTGRLRRLLIRRARQGCRVQLILPSKSDVPLSQLAAQSLYRRLLRAGVEVYEYQPQILHAKSFVVDDIVYVGSANLDPRSLSINYELMVRFLDQAAATDARKVFDEVLKHSRKVELSELRGRGTFWVRLKRWWAHFLLARVDPYVARRQWRSLPD
jgi:cardiolipin synthase A/B